MKSFLPLLFCAGLLAACESKSKKVESKSEPDSVTTTNGHETVTDPATVVPSPTSIAVIQQLADDFSGDSALLDLGNNRFMVVHQSELEEADADYGITCPSVDKSKKCHSNIFQGCIRGDMKTTMLPGRPGPPESIAQLLRRIPGDDRMKSMGLSSEEGAERVKAEKQNVSLKKVWLHMIYREEDNDFHLIIGDSPDVSRGMLMNVEISGIPRGASEDVANQFMRVRKQVINHPEIGDLKCGKVKGPLNPAIPILKLVGSLYFDNPHDGGTVGRGGIKAPSAWEIHPVKEIVFGGF